jgi:uncharacterized membrane-anchored protein
MRRLGWLGLILAFLVQAGLLGWILFDRAMLLQSGKEIRLAVVPVDPRDLLRGDYVILSYPISRIAGNTVTVDRPFNYYDTVYVSLAESGDTWKATALGHEKPASGVFLRGIVDNLTTRSGCTDNVNCEDYTILYNLEQFFVPEGKGRDLEKLRNDQKLSVDVAVADDGRAALKRLLVDGEPQFEEPLY